MMWYILSLIITYINFEVCDSFCSSYSLLRRYNYEIHEKIRNTLRIFETDTDIDSFKNDKKAFISDDEQFEQDLLDKQAKLRAMRSKKAAENPLTFFDSNVPEWRLQDAFNSTTIRALFDFGDEIATVWTQFGENLNKFGRLIAAKVEVDIKTTMKVANFVTQNTRSTSDDVFEGISDITAPLFELPEAVDQIRKQNKSETINMIRAGVNPLNTKPKLLSSLSAKSTNDRVKMIRKKRSEVKIPGMDAYRTSKTAPSVLKYDYERKKRNSPSNAASDVMDKIIQVLPPSVSDLQLESSTPELPSASFAASFDTDTITIPLLQRDSDTESNRKKKEIVDSYVDSYNNDDDATKSTPVLIDSLSESDRLLIVRAGVEFQWALGKVLSCVNTADDDIADLRENRQMVLDLLDKYENDGIEARAEESVNDIKDVNDESQVDTSALDRMVWRRVAERDELKASASALEAACIASQSFDHKEDRYLDASTVVLLLDGVLTLVNDKRWTWATSADKDRLSDSQSLLSEVGNMLLRAKTVVDSWSPPLQTKKTNIASKSSISNSMSTNANTDSVLDKSMYKDTSYTTPSSASSSAYSFSSEIDDMMLEDIESDDNLTDANRKIDDDGNDYRDVNVNAHNEDANADDVVIVEMEKNDATINMVDIDIDGDESDDNDADIPIVTATVVRFEEGVDLETQVVYSDDSEGGEVSVVSIPNEGATSSSASLFPSGTERDSSTIDMSDEVLGMNGDKPNDTVMFVDTEASETEAIEDQAVRVVLSSLDVTFFLIETFVQAVVPILSDGGRLAFKRTRQTLWPEVEEGRWRLPYKLRTSKAFQQESQIGVKKTTKKDDSASKIDLQIKKPNEMEDKKVLLPENTTV